MYTNVSIYVRRYIDAGITTKHVYVYVPAQRRQGPRLKRRRSHLCLRQAERKAARHLLPLGRRHHHPLRRDHVNEAIFELQVEQLNVRSRCRRHSLQDECLAACLLQHIRYLEPVRKRYDLPIPPSYHPHRNPLYAIHSESSAHANTASSRLNQCDTPKQPVKG